MKRIKLFLFILFASTPVLSFAQGRGDHDGELRREELERERSERAEAERSTIEREPAGLRNKLFEALLESKSTVTDEQEKNQLNEVYVKQQREELRKHREEIKNLREELKNLREEREKSLKRERDQERSTERGSDRDNQRGSDRDNQRDNDRERHESGVNRRP